MRLNLRAAHKAHALSARLDVGLGFPTRPASLFSGVTVTPGLAAGVSESSVSGALAQVSVNIPSVLVGQEAEILFRLIGGDSSSSSTVTISDVGVFTSSAHAVPEPSTFFLFGVGILGWLVFGRHVLRMAPHRSSP
jgi:hypothetical protein